MHRPKNITIIFLVLALVLITGLILFERQPKRMLLAPMIGGLDSCLFKKDELAKDLPNSRFTKLCLTDQTSASQLVEGTLLGISGEKPTDDGYRLGYTLYIPILKLFDKTGSEYKIKNEYIERIVNTVKNTDKPVILYFFSNHFEVDSPLEGALAADSANLLETKKGVLAEDKYYGSTIYPWSFVNLKNEVTHLREIAFDALLDGMCQLPKKSISRIEGITVLGELHHMFPDFQGGMGFNPNYLITDYSATSIKGFREFLIKKYSRISKLNTHLGAEFSGFEAILPPAKDIRTEPLNHFFEHIDAYAQGTFPITGWVASRSDKSSATNWIRIYANGQLVARVPVSYSRQDVVAAHPTLKSADVGWRYDFDFSKSPPGIYNFDIFFEKDHDVLMHLAKRQIAVMERNQAQPKPMTELKLPKFIQPDSTLLFSVDLPGDQSSYYYNPLAALWNEYRNLQITSYLNHFYDIASSKCISPDLIYSHQILPFVNPGWDEHKFAVGRDLAVPKRMALGVSLYGEAAYGDSFRQWFDDTGRKYYGVTEFHPLKSMTAGELASVFQEHEQRHARFISFFINGAGLGDDPAYKSNLFSFDLDNNNAGSDILYASVKEILSSQP